MSLGSSHPSLYSGFSSASIDKDVEQIAIVAKAVVASISRVISKADWTTEEKSNFVELGSHLYRASPVIMELRTTTDASSDLPDLLLCLLSNVDLTKNLVEKCLAGGGAVRDAGEVGITVKQLECAVHNIGHCLGSIPSSAFRNCRYADVAAKSISRDMRNTRFHADEVVSNNLERNEEESVAAASSGLSSPSDAEAPGPRLVDFIAAMHYSSWERDGNSGEYLPSPAEQIEPLYDSFFCPLTKKIMEDPVTIETGMTFERAAILEWFRSHGPADAAVACPVTRKTLSSRAIRDNLALKMTIEEWKARNETTRIKVARATLSKNTSEIVVREAMADLQLLCRSWTNKTTMCNAGVVPLLARFAEQKNRKLRFQAMETLRLLVQEHDEAKELAASTNAMAIAVKLLSSRHLPEKLVSVSLLLELSKSERLCEKIGAVGGGIAMLMATKNDASSDPSIAEKAEEALENLEKCSKNVGIMAENGFLDPLLDNLIRGSEELQTKMGSILGELFLSEDAIVRVAEQASEALMAMLRSGDSLARKAAMKTLIQLSSHRPNGQTLVNAGLLPAMAEELFAGKTNDCMADAAAVLANLLESGVDPEEIRVGPQGQTMGSDFFVENICRIILSDAPVALTESLVRILVSLMDWRRAALAVVKAVKAWDMGPSLVEFLVDVQDGLCAAAMELLIKLSPFAGHAIAEKLCKARGQPQGLIESLLTGQQISRKQELAAALLAKLPHRNVELNLCLIRHGAAAVLVREVQRIWGGDGMGSSHRRGFFQGLVGALVRFTATLHEGEVVLMAMKLNLAAVFTELVTGGAAVDEVQRLAALGLENLSSKSRVLSTAAPPAQQSKAKLFPRILNLAEKKQPICRVHGGLCSSSSTFCLVETGAVEALLGCLEHGAAAAAEAAMAAICTLLDDAAADEAGGAAVLVELGAVGRVLATVRRRREEGLQRRCFWFVERLLVHGGEEAKREIVGDRALPAILMGAVRGGDASMRQAAETILRRLNKVPDVSTTKFY